MNTTTPTFVEIETTGLMQRHNMSAYRVEPLKGARVQGRVAVGMTCHEFSVPGSRHYDPKITAPAMWIDYTPTLEDTRKRSLLTVNGKEYGEGFGASVSGRVEFIPAAGNGHLEPYYPHATVGGSDFYIRASINQFDSVTDGARKVLNALAEAIALEFVTGERWHAFQVEQAKYKVSRAQEKVQEATDKLESAQMELNALHV